MNVKKISLNDSAYSEILQITDRPDVLYYVGNIELLTLPNKLAVVGSRKVTSYGRAMTSRLVEVVAQSGIPIVSGLALGIDSIAHSSALQVGGKTIAVLPSGLERIYPASHTSLAKKIVDSGGLLISEYPGAEPPQKYRFIARNRIISGISSAVLIPEAAEKSGSLHTANFALDEGKDILAVPGNVTSPTSAGTNNLIKMGAKVVTHPDDIFYALNFTPSDQKLSPLASNQQEQQILDIIQSGVTDGAEIQIKSGLDASVFNQTLTMLEITGKIRSAGSGQWTL